MDSPVIFAGKGTWKDMRDDLVKKFSEAKNEKEFGEAIMAVYLSISQSEEEMQEKRRMFGIPET